ncbi:hypothetical protein DFJ67_1772 [Asanoa ferruginea]|uniref:Parallel beta helix pectate lyase-like protein n=1 Tax=Asanoa ferruginea TaxID=53367 RepID=A0A3D9ZQ94_9ACTN|nr:right-handed parallel beta-helix repeat-containing protein [Asanoa ferruginea]REF95810.1 hypothetical protein DFJ67_1772 [Asanoa ferruginea]GIF53272.1 hypothetical protein Afe04nite_78110 [Asanoa ferruginea]
MRVGRGLALLCVGVLVTAGLSAVGGSAAAADDPLPPIRVSQPCNGTPDGSSGSYCSITKAVQAAQPGQTVEVWPDTYDESVVVTRSGQPGKPITITAMPATGQRTTVRGAEAGPAFLLSGVHDVVIDGLDIGMTVLKPAVVVEDSSDVTIADGWVSASRAAALEIKGDSHGVTVRDMVARSGNGPVFAVHSGATDTLLTGNSVYAQTQPSTTPSAVTVEDAPRTTLTNNTIVTDCLVGVAVKGASAGFSLFNSILRTNRPTLPGGCTAGSGQSSAAATPLTVDGAATTDSHVDYNLVDPVHGGSLYAWGGTTYPNPAALAAATGQATHDIAADPLLTNTDGDRAGWSVRADSPAIDSALPDAPGVRSQDLRGNPHADNPDAPNVGGGYVDRGATELLPAPTVTSAIARAPGGGSLEAIATATATYPWRTDGPAGAFSFAIPGQWPVVGHTGSARFTFPKAGPACVDIKVSNDGFRGAVLAHQASPCVVLGASFTPVPPQRVLDTRSGLGAPSGAPLEPGADLHLSVPASMRTAAAVVLNVTVTQPTANGYLKVYPDDDSQPTTSSINFLAKQTVANLVTVRNGPNGLYLSNASAGTTHVVADIAGYYANTGSGLTSASPVRVLDTRAAIGVPGTTPIGPNGKVTVDLSAKVPAGTTAAVLNLTVTKPTTSGHITVFPPGAAVPTTSNVNFLADQTVNNMVIAPVVDGKVAFAFGGAGTVHLLADLSSWFAPGATDTYLPTSPTRILDTRTTATPVGPGKTVRVTVNASVCGSAPCPRTAIVANLTVTNAKSDGYLSVYPFGQPRPVVSALNFTKGQTVANLVTVGLGQDSFLVYNNGGSTVDVIVDQAGFYLSPA